MEPVSIERIRRDVYRLASDPLPFRKLNYTVPGHAKSTLEEADDLIMAELRAAGWDVSTEPVRVQAFRCDASKPKAHQYSRPDPTDPWYTAHNIYAVRAGSELPDEIIVLCAHKDSQSWVDSPGAHDNATGTAALLELARALKDYAPRRSVHLLFCNEEHTPWTSVAAAKGYRDRGDNVVAVLNCDGFGVRSAEQKARDEKSHGIRYTVDDGRWLADLMVRMDEEHGIGLTQYVSKRETPGDDDGSFVKAGFGAAIFTGGGGAGDYEQYHREDDTPDTVDFESVAMLTRATLAALLELDAGGRP